MRTKMRISSFALLALLVVSGCGGDGSSTPLPAPSPSQSQVLSLPKVASPVAECLGRSAHSHGIEGTGLRKIQGVVTAVSSSSVTVSDILFDASHAVVFVNGICATLGDVNVGASATVDGEVDDATHTGTAFTIYADETVVGGINSIDSSAGTLSVNGQEIVVTSATVFGDDIQPPQLSALIQSDMIAVSGSLRHDGTLVATHIHRWPTAAYESVTGVVTSIETTSGLLHVSGVQVHYTDSLLVGFSDGVIHIGDYIRALGGALYDVTGIDAVAIQRAVVPAPDPSKDIVLAGAVSNVRTADDFDVMGQPVKTTSSTRFAGILMDLVHWGPRGYFVTVFGSLDSSGYVVADLVVSQKGSTIILAGPITAIDRGTRTVDVIGIPVRLSGAYSYLERDALVTNFDALNVGDQLAVEGSPLDTGVVDALIARQSAPSLEAYLNGWKKKSYTRPILVMFDGIQADTTNAQFFNGLPLFEADDPNASWLQTFQWGKTCFCAPSSADSFWQNRSFMDSSIDEMNVFGIWTGDHINATKVYWVLEDLGD